MATVRERLVYAIEVVTDRAQAGFKGFKQSVADADGAVGKFKAGASSALATVQANAGTLALAGGAALTTFAAKSVAAFQETAIAAGKFSDATGLAVEDASRLIEVAGDVGVEVGTIESAIAKMNQAAAKGDLGKFGVELQRTSDGTVDVNKTFLETIRVLNGIADPTERALAAQKIFGKGYKEVAEIIFDSADNVARKLDDVSGSKVIDEKELAKARKFRESMDNLKDSLEDVELAAGEALVPLLSDLADVVVGAKDAKNAIEDIPVAGRGIGELFTVGITTPFKEFDDHLRDLGEGLGIVGEKAGPARAELDRYKDSVNDMSVFVERAADETEAAADEVVDLGDKAANAGPKIGDMADTLQDLADNAAKDAEEALGNVATAAQAVADAVDTAFDDIDARFRQQDLLADIAQGWEDIAASAEEAVKGGAEDRRAYERDVRNQRRAVLDLVESIDGLSPDKKIRLSAEIETGSIQTLHDIVAQLQGGIVVPVSFQTQPGFTSVSGGLNINTGSGGLQFNGGTTAPPVSGNVTNIYPVGTTPTSAQQDLTTFYRRNGFTRLNIPS